MGMLDTVKLQSPYLREATVEAISGQLERRICIDMKHEKLIYEFTSGSLSGSYDHRISVQVQRTKMVARKREGGRRPLLEQVNTPPYLLLEGSVHKALLGHNVYGGPRDLVPAVRWFVAHVAQLLGVTLPSGGDWRLCRADWAHVYDLGSYEAVSEFVSYLHHARYPRRNVNRYGDDSFQVPGSTTSLNLYAKGPEFQKHDRSRIARHDPAAASQLQLLASTLLRCEVQVHARGLDELNGVKPGGCRVSEVDVAWLEEKHRLELTKLLREGTSVMQTVRTAAAVKARLYEVYSGAQARSLYGAWLELAAMGEGPARQSLPRRTFYHYRKLLQSAGVSWHDTNVKLSPAVVRLVPEDFVPLPHDPRCISSEAPEVTAALAPYRKAS
jgi:II/X family phage/plasmid replication protein